MVLQDLIGDLGMVLSGFIERLREQNPWWSSPGAIQGDRHLQALEAAAFLWRPRLLDDVVLDRPRVYTIRGPRQVGKTTSVKLMIRRLLEGGNHHPSFTILSTSNAIRRPSLR